MGHRTKILFLASNPDDMQPLHIDEELRAISTRIRAADYRDLLELRSCWAVRPDDLLQELNAERPTIVHFSGHGSAAGELYLVDSAHRAHPVPAGALRKLFATLKDNIRLVVLNGCYSAQQGAAIAGEIDCVVGMSRAIEDRAAIVFAAAFYRALGFARSVEAAVEQGKVALQLEGIPEEDAPELLHAPGVDPSKVILVDPWRAQHDVVGNNLEVARAILALGGSVAAARPARREQVAAYYQKIATTLEEVVERLRAGEIPHGACERMRQYGLQLPETIGDLVGPERARALAQQLQDAYNVESLYDTLQEHAQRETSLADLAKAGAYFEVAADSLLAAP